MSPPLPPARSSFQADGAFNFAWLHLQERGGAARQNEYETAPCPKARLQFLDIIDASSACWRESREILLENRWQLLNSFDIGLLSKKLQEDKRAIPKPGHCKARVNLFVALPFKQNPINPDQIKFTPRIGQKWSGDQI